MFYLAKFLYIQVISLQERNVCCDMFYSYFTSLGSFTWRD